VALIDDIRRQARREAEVIDLATSGYEGELARVLRDLNRRIRRLVTTLDSTDGRLVATRQALGRAVRLRLEIATILEEAGFRALAEAAFDDPLDRLTARVLDGRTLAGRAARLTPIDVEVLSAWREIRLADLLEVGDDVATAVWRATVDGVIASRDMSSLVDEIEAVTEVSARQARTVYDTAVSTYSRQVDQLGISPEPGDKFLYVGPDDTATRPFCRRFVGQVRTRAELDDIDNGQLPNTLLTAGGWNCRHKWFYLADLEPSEVAA
jgi:hypothetical protein